MLYLILLITVRSFGLNIFPTTALVQVVLDVDTSIFSEPNPMDVEKEKDIDARSLFYSTFPPSSYAMSSSRNVIFT